MITFCINTSKNELNHVKLLFKSLEQNLSTKEHEILVFIDSDNQNTFEWLLTQKSVFPNLKILKNNLPICYGYARNINEMFEQASNEIVSYLQSDMVIRRDYDLEILKKLEPNMILCSTRIEPPLHGPANEVIINNFGLNPSEFDFNAFVEFADQHKQDKVTEYFFAPFTLYKSVWLSIGGHDTLFRRSREDSDVLTRLVLNDVRIIQVWNALVYHFTCTSSRGSDWFNRENSQAQERVQLQQVADNIEIGRFLRKWGNFSHSIQKSKHYNIVANILGDNLELQKFANFELFFDTVFVEDVSIVSAMQDYYDKLHVVANKLFGISDDDWDTYGYIYNKQEAVDRIKPITESVGDVVVEFALDQVDMDYISEFISKLQEVVDEADDTGLFEYGPFVVKINNKLNKVSHLIKVTNPKIKPEHLYTIH